MLLQIVCRPHMISFLALGRVPTGSLAYRGQQDDKIKPGYKLASRPFAASPGGIWRLPLLQALFLTKQCG
jgi:hypothetical protein